MNGDKDQPTNRRVHATKNLYHLWSLLGKCTVTLLNETESLISYLNKDDAYFYSLVYDPQQKTLLADKGEIHVGSRYQVDHIPKAPEFKVYP